MCPVFLSSIYSSTGAWFKLNLFLVDEQNNSSNYYALVWLETEVRRALPG